MIRRSLAIVLLVAALASLGLGAYSYRRGVPRSTLWISAVQTEPRFQAAMINGTLHAVYSAPPPPSVTSRAATQPAWASGAWSTPGDIDQRWAGFYVRRRSIGSVVATGVGAPFWAIFGLLMLSPITEFLRGPLHRRRRRRRGLCIHCGYNLTGLIEPRCPECGQPFARPAPAPAPAR